MKNIASKADNTSSLSAEAFNSMASEMENAVTAAGLTLDVGAETVADPDPSQLSAAIAMGARAAQFFTDSGSANTYTLTKVGSWKTETAYRNGAVFRFVPANSNSGASTINIQGIGAKDLRDTNGTALTAGAVTSGMACEVYYNSGSDHFRITDRSASPVITGTPVFTGALSLTAGSVASPTLAWASDIDGNGTGLYRVGANSTGFAANGVLVGSHSSAGAWTWGPSGAGAVNHVFNGAFAAASSQSGGTAVYSVKNSGAAASGVSFTIGANRTSAGVMSSLILENTVEATSVSVVANRVSSTVLSMILRTYSSGDIDAATVSGPGAWTWGPSSGLTTTHQMRGETTGTAGILEILNTGSSGSFASMKFNPAGGADGANIFLGGSGGYNFKDTGGTTVLQIGSNPASRICTITGYFDASGASSGVKVNAAKASPAAADTENTYSGTYTAVLSASSGTTARAGAIAQWTRVGNVVTVTGTFSFTPTAVSGDIVMFLSLPISKATAWTAGGLECGGTANASRGGGANSFIGFYVIGNSATPSQSQVQFLTSYAGGATSNYVGSYTFSYLVS